jgi:hypothetical protein
MTMNLLVYKAVAISKRGVQVYRSYRLHDMAYGEFLVYEGVRPVYYLNVFDKAYAGLSDYIHDNKIQAQQLITQILRLNGQTMLSAREDVWLRSRSYGTEDEVLYELLPFPAACWMRAKHDFDLKRRGKAD